MRLTGLNKSITNALGKLSPQPKQTIVKGPIGFPAGGMAANAGIRPVPVEKGSAMGTTPPPGGLASMSQEQINALPRRFAAGFGTPIRVPSGSAMGTTPPPGGAGLASMSTQQMQGILKGTPVGYSGPTPQSTVAKAQQSPTGMKKGGSVKNKTSSKTYKSGGSVSSASKRADGCAIKGKTKGRFV